MMLELSPSKRKYRSEAPEPARVPKNVRIGSMDFLEGNCLQPKGPTTIEEVLVPLPYYFDALFNIKNERGEDTDKIQQYLQNMCMLS